MNTHNEFREFLKLLQEQNCEFVLVGGYAVAFHGYIRATQDIDIFFRNTPENVDALRAALDAFGLPTTEDQRQDFSAPGSILRMGVPPARIELLNQISGLTFDEVWNGRVQGSYGDLSVDFISLIDLLRNKREAGRAKDLADVDELGGNQSKEDPS